MRIELNQFPASAPGLSVMEGVFDGPAPVNTQTRETQFTRTLAATRSGDYLFEIGAGTLSPSDHTRVLLSYAWDSQKTFNEVSQKWFDLRTQLASNRSIMTKIVARVIGTQKRAVRPNEVTQVTPMMVFESLSDALPESYEAVYIHLATDFISSVFARMGWMLPDHGFIFRIKRAKQFPSYEDLVDLVQAHEFKRTLEALYQIDISLLQKVIDSKKAISPAQVVANIQSGITRSIDISSGAYDARSIVAHTLTALLRHWDPQCPQELKPKDRVRKSEIFNDFTSNLGMFLAGQDMLRARAKSKSVPSYIHTDDEMVNVVLPTLNDAIGTLDMFKVRMLLDVVNHISKSSTKTAPDMDHGTTTFGRAIVNEEWEFSQEVRAFRTIRHSMDSRARLLALETTATTALSAALTPIHALLKHEKMVAQRLSTYELVNAETGYRKGSYEVMLGFPSLLVYEREMGFRGDALADALMKGKLPTEIGVYSERGEEELLTKVTEGHKRAFEWIKYDYKALMTHLVVAHTNMSTIHSSTPARSKIGYPYLSWKIDTGRTKALGASAIVQGTVIVTEPVEALAYISDFYASEKLVRNPLKFEEFPLAIHMWDWHPSSTGSVNTYSYKATHHGESVDVIADTYTLMGLDRQHEKMRIMVPALAAATTKLWYDWTVAEIEYLSAQLKTVKKTDAAHDAIHGRMQQVGMLLTNTLLAIGNATVAARVSSQVELAIHEELAEKDKLVLVTEFTDGIAQRRIAIWSALVTMQMLGLITQAQGLRLLEVIRDTRALSLTNMLATAIE